MAGGFRNFCHFPNLRSILSFDYQIAIGNLSPGPSSVDMISYNSCLHVVVDEDFGGFATNVLKSAAEYVGIAAGSVRPPFHDLTAEEKTRLAGILKELGVPVVATT